MVRLKEHQAAEDMMVQTLERELEISEAMARYNARKARAWPAFRGLEMNDNIRYPIRTAPAKSVTTRKERVTIDGEIVSTLAPSMRETPTQAMERAARDLREFQRIQRNQTPSAPSMPSTITVEDLGRLWDRLIQEQVERIMQIIEAGKPAGRRKK